MAKNPEMVGIYCRKGTYWLNYQHRHSRQFISLGTRDLAAAIVKARELRGSAALNEGGTVRAEIERYLAHKRAGGEFTDNTVRNARGFLSHLSKAVGGLAPMQVTAGDAQRFYDTLRQRMTESSAQTYVAHARSFFRWVVEAAKLTRENPFDAVSMPLLVPVARKEHCPPELRDKLLAECPRDDLRFVLYCGFHAALRRNEIVHARPTWFDLKARLLHLRKVTPELAKTLKLDPFDLKDQEERTVPLSKEFTKFLKGWLDPAADYCLAPGKRQGRSRYRYDFRRFFEDYMKAQACPWVTAHTMRRTFASIQATKGTSIYIIATWLGDDIETTRKHYGHLAPAHATLEKGL